jgi:hypothetical protein
MLIGHSTDVVAFYGFDDRHYPPARRHITGEVCGVEATEGHRITRSPTVID